MEHGTIYNKLLQECYFIQIWIKFLKKFLANFFFSKLSVEYTNCTSAEG